jgi:hypothetical protein
MADSKWHVGFEFINGGVKPFFWFEKWWVRFN